MCSGNQVNKGFEKLRLIRISYLRVLSGVAAMLIGSLVSEQVYAGSMGQLCLKEKTGLNNPACTANDVRIGHLELVGDPISCVGGQQIAVTLKATIESGPERYDIGIWVNEMGGSARSDPDGTCTREFFEPLSGNNSDCNQDNGPFFNAETALPNDKCGDVPAVGVNPCNSTVAACTEGGGDCIFSTYTFDAMITCADENDDLIADTGTCTSWDNVVGDDCKDEMDTDPGTGSKCNCGVTNIGGITFLRQGRIKVCKDVTPNGNNAGGFDLKVNGDTELSNAGDGDCTEFIPVSAGTSAEPGATNTVSEAAFGGTSLSDYVSSISCDNDAASSCTDCTSLDVFTMPDEDITCTITNHNDPCDTAACPGDIQCATISCDPNGAEGNCDVIVPKTGQACDNETVCDGREVCSASGTCEPGTPLTCDDNNACNGDETCDPVNGCQAGTPLTCDDNNACNGVETCDPTDGCLAGDVLECDDRDLCNGVESCEPETGCVAGSALLCDNGDFCDGMETCNAELGCMPGTPPNCDDGVSCTDDSCNEGTDSCDNIPNDSHCDDGVECTDDSCDAVNDCQNDANDANCDDGMFCNGAETCDPVNDCQAGTDIDCSDAGDQCNDGMCDEINDRCDGDPKDAGTPCGDSTDTDCDGADTCDGAGTCIDNLADVGAPCGDQTDSVCDNPNTCDGAGECLENYEPGTTVCRADAGDCDVEELCDGIGNCPEDVFEPEGTPCREDDECRESECNGEGCCELVSVVEDCIDETCRTAGFWGSHGGREKTKSTNITQEVIDAAGGCLNVCGEAISSTNVDDANSAIEAICVSVKGDSILQLTRQLTAAALNCVMSSSDPLCKGVHIEEIFLACNDACAAGERTADVGGDTIDCIDAIDCFNNGGKMIAESNSDIARNEPGSNDPGCNAAVCAMDSYCCDTMWDEFCVAMASMVNMQNPDICQAGTYFCAMGDPDSCHEKELCNENFSDLCFMKTGPAGSSRACNEARKDTECTVIEPGELECSSGLIESGEEGCAGLCQ